MDFQIGTVDVALLVLGITQGVKAIFGVEGKVNVIVAFAAGFALVAISHGIAEGLISELWVPYIVWAATSLGGALAAIGVYEFGKRGVGLLREVNGK